MSAYIVSDQTINRVLAYLVRWDTGYLEVLAKRHADGNVDTLGGALRDLNVRAVLARYPDCSVERGDLPGPCPLLPYAFRLERTPTAVAAYKAVSCLLYQCAEGDAPDTALYQDLETVRARIASEVISKLPEYDQAPWG